MKLVLTDKVSGKKMLADVNAIKLVEPADGGGAHIVFGADMGRVVVETVEQIQAIVGAVTPLPLA